MNIYSKFQSMASMSQIIRGPKKEIKTLTLLKEGVTIITAPDNQLYKANEEVWIKPQYETLPPTILKSDETQEYSIASKICYEPLNKPLYIEMGREKEFSRYFIPNNEGVLKLCNLNGGNSYNNIVITPDDKIINKKMVGFITIEYLHNNKNMVKKIPVTVEKRECNKYRTAL